MNIIQIYHVENKLREDDNVHFILDKTHLDGLLYSVNSLKQQSAPLGNIILIPSKPFFAFSP
jgi:hypothetical protein